MDQNDIVRLKDALFEQRVVIWNPDDETGFRIRSIGPPPPEKDPEPSECAYGFNRLQYLALYNANISDFIVGDRLSETVASGPSNNLEQEVDIWKRRAMKWQLLAVGLSTCYYKECSCSQDAPCRLCETLGEIDEMGNELYSK